MSHRTRPRRRGQRRDPVPFVRGLGRVIPPERIDRVLLRTGRQEKRRRKLPASSVVWLVVAMALLADLSVPKAFRALRPSTEEPDPDDSAFTKVRQRLGVAPPRELFLDAAAELAPAGTPGVFYNGWRLMGIDGTTLDVPDTEANEAVFGRRRDHRAAYASPQLRAPALCELGTRQVCALAFRPVGHSEQSMVPALLPGLGPGMPLPWGRNFFGHQMIQGVVGRGAGLLARVETGLVFRRVKGLAGGSYVSKVYPTWYAKKTGQGGTLVRVIEYTHDDPGRPGRGTRVRLLTTVLDPGEMPALEAAALHHERWEEERVFDEIKTHLNPVRETDLRSKTPRGVVQELYGIVLAHRVVRQVVSDAAAAKEQDPDRLSFADSVRVLKQHLAEAPRRTAEGWYRRLVREVGWQQLRPRRDRYYPRVVKREMKQWDKKRPEHSRPPQPTKRFAEAVVIT